MEALDRASFGDVARSLLFYVVFYTATMVLALSALCILPFSRKAFVSIVHGWSGFQRICARYILGIRVKIEGKAPGGKVLVAIKHESMFEAVDLPTLLTYPAIFAKVELLRLPIWGQTAGAYGLVPVERDRGATALRAMLAAARKMTAEGRMLAIFPEGTRVPHGYRAPLGAGFSGLYKILGLPVVPVAVNSGPLYHRRWKKPGTITVRFGDPIPAGLPREEVEVLVTDGINALNS